MKLFFAGNVLTYDPEMHLYGIRNRLLTFAEIDGMGKHAFAYWIEQEKLPCDSCLFLDSGAFSAFTRGIVIDLGVYCAYIEKYLPSLHCYAALDVVGGNWQASERNLQIMLKRGLDPVAVYHHQDPWSVLDMLLERHKFIALGGMVGSGASRDDLKKYLDRCFSVIGKHWPVKIHGFGIMAGWALEKFPFYSVDSSSAIVSAGMGQVNVFEYGKIVSYGWHDYSRRTMDGGVMDGVALDRAKKGSAYMGRRAMNIRAQLQLEKFITDLWTSRGIVWS